ncbi:hypothetical protein ACFVH6_22210 [Spirillospora sp. NPDC127200]
MSGQPRVKIRVHIGVSFSANADHEETVTGPPRDEWDAMTSDERDTYLSETAEDVLANYLDLSAYVIED